ncbi:svop [Symbiodinium necroappetens]|uniref:Svop protein n=1 Tax=Symbiodinium necroappetens TaxID=1628268 RepID=A0A812PC49_9DINO|nr:svop [Symbiodinium necroappetens]
MTRSRFGFSHPVLDHGRSVAFRSSEHPTGLDLLLEGLLVRRRSWMSKHEDSAEEVTSQPELQDVINQIGMGPAQIFWGLLGGGVWLADGAELLLVSSVTRSLQSEWHLTPYMKGTIVSAVYLGILIGNYSSGPCSQRFGRREMIVTSYSGIFLCGILSCASASAYEFLVIRFFGGIFIGVGQPAWLAISSEVTPVYWKVVMAAASQSLFVFGEMYVSFVIMMDDMTMQVLHWRLLLRFGALPSLCLAAISMLYLNESPIFLALKGHIKEARTVIETMARQNQAMPTSLRFRQPHVHPPDTSILSQMRRQMSVVFQNALLVPTIVLMSTCFTLNLTYFGCLFAFPQVLPTLMHGQAASELLVGALWELPGLALGLLLGISATRRTALKFYLTSLSCFLLCFIVGVHYGQSKLPKAMLLIGYYGVKCVPNIGFIVAYQMSAELYPTEARTMGSALCLAGGRLAAMLAPMVYESIVTWTGGFLPFFLVMATMCVSNLYMVGG